MSKLNITEAFIFSKRAELRDVIRQAFKAQHLDSGSIYNVTDLKEMVERVESKDYAFLALDWAMGVDQLQRVLEKNRSQHKLEAHPTFLLSSQAEDGIIGFAKEFHITHVNIGEVTSEQVNKQVRELVDEYQHLSPIRQILLNVDSVRLSGDQAKAHQLLNALYQKSTDNPRVIVELAESAIELGQWSEAENILETYIKTGQPNARMKHLYARCRLKAGDYDAAVNALRGAQAISPFNPGRLLEMGDIFLELDRIDEAMDSFSEVLKFVPKSQEAKLGKSKGHLLAGEINEALMLLNECASKRELSSVFNTAAILAIRQNKFDEGMNLYAKAIQLLQSDSKLVSRIVYNLGIGWVKSGEVKKALTCFQKAHKLDPSFDHAKHNASAITKQVKKGAAAGQSSGAIKESIKDVTNDFDADLLDGLDESIETPTLMGDQIDDTETDSFDLDDILSDLDDVS